ncbi:MAG: efflux RND transporter periplasmic adaptor subunit [Archangium sp.]|nr:efflux RND transporter periplasmic adaptor subunit [Archangium sp.]
MNSSPLLWAAPLVFFATCAKPPPTAAPPRAVRVATVTLRPVAQSARYSGVLESRAQLDLAFRVPGRVASVGQVRLSGAIGPSSGATTRALQEGDVVKAGDVLATLDLDDLRRQRSASAAGAASTAAQVRTARTSLAQAEREVARARKVFANGDLAQAELDRAEAAFAAAGSSLASIEAQHQSRISQLALSQSSLTDATLRSPIDGVVSRKNVDPGELVPPNVPVFSVVDVSELRVVFGVPDTRVNLVRLGAPVTVVVEALPGRRLPATVSKVAPTADPALRTYAVELRLEGTSELRPGMTATALLGDEGQQDAPVLPLSAVVRHPDGAGYVVFGLKSDSTVELLPIEVADLLENDVVVASGLTAGSRVVVDGAQFLRAGERVGVVP